jgi:hypothetical protein
MKYEKEAKRLKKFIDSLDNGEGKSMTTRQFAQSINSEPQKWYVVLRGDGLPTLTSLHDIKAKYPEFSIDYFLTGAVPYIDDRVVADKIEALESSLRERDKELHETKRNLIFANSIIDRRGTDEDKKLMGMVNFNNRVLHARSECKIIPFNPDYSSMKTA